MRAQLYIKLSLFVLFLTAFYSSTYAQNCTRKDFCNKDDYADFDFRSQSSFAVLVPGDTARTSIVAYANQSTRVLVCNDPVLGAVKFKMYTTDRVTEKTIQEIRKFEEEQVIYKMDEYGSPVQKYDEWTGEPMYDEYYNPVYEIERYETVVTYDTIWNVERVVKEVLVFDSERDNGFYEKNITVTQKMIIEVIVPMGSRDITGCVSVMVGHKPIPTSSGFRRY